MRKNFRTSMNDCRSRAANSSDTAFLLKSWLLLLLGAGRSKRIGHLVRNILRKSRIGSV